MAAETDSSPKPNENIYKYGNLDTQMLKVSGKPSPSPLPKWLKNIAKHRQLKK